MKTSLQRCIVFWILVTLVINCLRRDVVRRTPSDDRSFGDKDPAISSRTPLVESTSSPKSVSFLPSATGGHILRTSARREGREGLRLRLRGKAQLSPYMGDKLVILVVHWEHRPHLNRNGWNDKGRTFDLRLTSAERTPGGMLVVRYFVHSWRSGRRSFRLTPIRTRCYGIGLSTKVLSRLLNGSGLVKDFQD